MHILINEVFYNNLFELFPHMRTWDVPSRFSTPGQDEPDDVLEAKALAERLGIEHHVADVRKEFQQIIVCLLYTSRASHSVRIYQPLEVASEVVVHRITQVGRIRADY